MPESYIAIWMSLGEAQHTLECLAELDDSEAGIPERPYEIIEDAIATEHPRTFEEMDRARLAMGHVGRLPGPPVADDEEAGERG